MNLIFFRISHFPRFCSKQKNTQQGQSWLVITVQPFQRNDLKPGQADSPNQARHISLVAALSVVKYKDLLTFEAGRDSYISLKWAANFQALRNS